MTPEKGSPMLTDPKDREMVEGGLIERAAVVKSIRGTIIAGGQTPEALRDFLAQAVSDDRIFPSRLTTPTTGASAPGDARRIRGAKGVAGKNDMALSLLVRVDDEAPVELHVQARGASNREPLRFLKRAAASLNAEIAALSTCPIHTALRPSPQDERAARLGAKASHPREGVRPAFSQTMIDLLDAYEQRVWVWAQGCEIDSIQQRSQIGDSYNEGHRDDVAKARSELLHQIDALTWSDAALSSLQGGEKGK